MYAVARDPGNPNNHGLAIRSGNSWSAKSATNIGPTEAFHLYEIVSYAGSLWIAGDSVNRSAQTQTPMIRRSTNGGSTWTAALTLPNLTGPGFASFFGLAAVLNGKLYTQATYIHGQPAENFTRIYDGSSWTTGPTIFPFWGRSRKANEFKNHIVFIHNINSLVAFNGSATNNVGTVAITDYTIDNGFIYILRQTNKMVYRTDRTDGTHFVEVDQAPLNASSIGVLNNVLYVGTENSQIHKSDVDLSAIAAPPIVAPVNYLLLTNN